MVKIQKVLSINLKSIILPVTNTSDPTAQQSDEKAQRERDLAQSKSNNLLSTDFNFQNLSPAKDQ